MLKKINYRSDFDFILNLATRIKNEDGTYERRPLEWLDFDWTATFWTSNKANAYVASRKGDILTNCFEDNGKIHIVVNNHRLGKGTLKVEFHALLPDNIYPDSIRDTYDPQPLDIELVSGSGDCATSIEAELLLPMLKGDKGDPFTFDDFTAEQIADLQRPAVEAAKRADEATADAMKATSDANDAANYAKEATKEATEAASKAEAATKQTEQLNQDVIKSEQNRVTAENARNAAEQSRIEAENLRVSNEDARKRAESIRESAETARDEAEQGRETAEHERAEDENLRKSNEQTRIANESQRNTNENQRIANEQSRVSAESVRVTEFATLKEDAITATASANQAAKDANAAVADIPENIVAYTPTDTELEAIEPNIVTNALRKTPQHLSQSEQTQVLKNLGNPEIKLFDEIWKSLGGTVITPGITYGLNGLNNLTLDDALKIKRAGYPNSIESTSFYANRNIRTNLWRGTYGGQTRNGNNMYYRCTAEVIYADYVRLDTNTFAECSNLREISGAVYGTTVGVNTWFRGCVNLEEFVFFTYISKSINLSDCPKLKITCFNFIEANNSSGYYTITVHPDVYAKLTDETNTEWYALLSAAAAKNIQFITA